MSDIFREVDEEVRRDKAADLWKKYGKHDNYCLKDRTEHICWRLGGSYIYVRLPRVIGDDFEISYGLIAEDPETLARAMKLFKACAGPVSSKI